MEEVEAGFAEEANAKIRPVFEKIDGYQTQTLGGCVDKGGRILVDFWLGFGGWYLISKEVEELVVRSNFEQVFQVVLKRKSRCYTGCWTDHLEIVVSRSVIST